MRALLLFFLFCSAWTVPARAQVGALQTDCKLGGGGPGGYQFVATCAGRARSPDGHFAVVQRAYQDKQPPIEVQDARGRVVARLSSISDDMPFSVHWAPNSRWFFVNHHVGSFMDVLRVFEIAGGKVIERPALGRAAVKTASLRYPCLGRDMVLPNGVRWARGGHSIVLVTISRPDACSSDHTNRPGRWKPLWMIGDARTGRVEARSIQPNRDARGLREPRGGLYSRP
ncbi:hypothetical protein JMG10_39185 [Nostoc ellipsosporum NOK]|nr:hypothetical protein [Nostoc ellipsosporum NOK]OSZ69960.1 hypothetical protein CAP40_03765 [Sphingomonas sp. IBVSS2]